MRLFPDVPSLLKAAAWGREWWLWLVTLLETMTWDEGYSPMGGTVFSIPSTASSYYACAPKKSSIYISFWCEYLNGL